jgi:hypothetical protein
MGGEQRPDTPEREYAPLRQEILYWQNYRFTLLAASIALVLGVVGFGLKDQGSSRVWPFTSSMLLAFLALAAGLSGYAARGNARIGANLTVFHDLPLDENKRREGAARGWEGRQERFWEEWAKRRRWFRAWLGRAHLGMWLAGSYLILGGVSVAIPWAANRAPEDGVRWAFLVVFGVLLLAGVLFLWWSPRGARLEYWKAWNQVKRDENPQQPGSSA